MAFVLMFWSPAVDLNKDEPAVSGMLGGSKQLWIIVSQDAHRGLDLRSKVGWGASLHPNKD